MNSNAYLGMSLRLDVMAAEEESTRTFGAGPGAVRFISGTCRPHVEEGSKPRSPAFHAREAGMIFSSAYATTLGVLVPLITDDTVIVSDELNHNCIINAMRLARPKAKAIYKHLDLEDLEARIDEAAGTCRRQCHHRRDLLDAGRPRAAGRSRGDRAPNHDDDAFPRTPSS
ncbi:MAG: aminotransferase class I/II-fold pyridoxal phosphate-dependent enzyme [Thermoanaerobaculia bacterium]